MKYISLDIETTGFDPIENDILEIGIYLEDTSLCLDREKLPCFHCYIWKEIYRGNAYALAMNAHIITKILELKRACPEGTYRLLAPSDVISHIANWLYKNRKLFPSVKMSDTFPWGEFPKLVVAGKNVAGFDLPFIRELPRSHYLSFYHRTIDPAMLYFDPKIDEIPPDLSTCKKRAGFETYVSHNALDDAWDVIRLIRHKTK
jgi:oligoribonuclease